MPRHILVAVAWPYASGSLHLGHLAGAYLPADIFARYHRLAGNRVLMVSGSDAHGTPITIKADQEGVSPAEIVARYHPEILGYWRDLGISFDLFTTTLTDNHREVTWDIFRKLRAAGYVVAGTSLQFFDPDRQRFLPDRYVEGSCPHCGYNRARGDQCENCGRTLDPDQLINPRSSLSGATPEKRETQHYFLRLGAFTEALRTWLTGQTTWRRHVQNWALGMVAEGMPDRAITRDLSWGIPIPTEADTLGKGKVIYVWFEAVIGYLSAAKEWAARSGDPQAWRLWWNNPEAESYYFVGKDNIPFHAVVWPAMLMGYGEHNLPTDVPANQYVTFKGAKASKSMGVGRPIAWYAARLQPDALRYAIAAVLPEQGDTDLSDDDIIRRVNDELVATWGNLVNRVVSLCHRYFDGRVPAPGEADDRDNAMLAAVAKALATTGQHIEAVELRAGLRAAFDGAAAVNGYLNEVAPWQTARTDLARTGSILAAALSAIASLAVALAPYLPFSADQVWGLLGLPGSVAENGWHPPAVETGASLGAAIPLYRKLEADVLDSTD